MLACALRSSSSQKSHFVAIFGSPVVAYLRLNSERVNLRDFLIGEALNNRAKREKQRRSRRRVSLRRRTFGCLSNHGKKFCLFQNFFRELQFAANLAELSAAVCCEFEDNPIALAMLGTTEVFLCAAFFRAHLYRNAANSPSSRKPQVCGKLGALRQKRGFATRRRLFNIARFSDAQQIFLA